MTSSHRQHYVERSRLSRFKSSVVIGIVIGTFKYYLSFESAERQRFISQISKMFAAIFFCMV